METTLPKDAETEILQIVQRKPGSRIFFLLVTLFWVACSCHPSSLYEQGVRLPNQGWHRDSALLFTPAIQDTSRVLNFGLTLHHNNRYPYSNLWLFIEVQSPDGIQQVDTLEYFLAEPDGQWMGKGRESDRQIYWLYKANVKMRNPGIYSVKIYQGMRNEWLQGIGEVSFWIEETKQ